MLENDARKTRIRDKVRKQCIQKTLKQKSQREKTMTLNLKKARQ